MDKSNLLGQSRSDVGKHLVDHHLCFLDHTVDASHCCLKIVEGALGVGDCFLPIPLVNIERVEIVELLVGTDSVHVSVEPETGSYVVIPQLGALPLCQRVDHLRTAVAQIFHRKGHRTLHPVEIVVEAGARQHKEGSSDSPQA